MEQSAVSDTVLSQRVVRSYSDARKRGSSFGPPGPGLPGIDTLADSVPAGEYKATLAYVLAVVSTWAYADERALAAKLRYYGIEGARVRRITVQNDALLIDATAYFIQSASGKTGILAFRGTDPANIINYLSDGEVMQRPFGATAGGDVPRVHSGFYANVEALWDDVVKCVADAGRGEPLATRSEPSEDGSTTNQAKLEGLKNLYVTGHSLGGAMGVLASARLLNDGFDDQGNPIDKAWARSVVKGIYTFGQPMVGDPTFMKACEATVAPKLFRHIYDKDVVPHAPPKSDLRYVHFGKEFRAWTLAERWTERDTTADRAGFIRAVFGVAVNAAVVRTLPGAMPARYSLDDHMPSNYLDVSRYTVDPNAGHVVAPNWRAALEAKVLPFRDTVRGIIGANGH